MTLEEAGNLLLELEIEGLEGYINEGCVCYMDCDGVENPVAVIVKEME